MKSYIQILTTPTADTSGTILLLHFDNKRYLIGNITEGTQRAIVQIGARVLKTNEIFMTGRAEWANTGGLIGMILTLADSSASSAQSKEEERKKGSKGFKQNFNNVAAAEKTKFTIFGAPNLNYTLAAARRFVFRKGMPLETREITDRDATRDAAGAWLPTWFDDNIRLWSMAILPSRSGAEGVNDLSKGTVSPRKRSFDMLNGVESANGSYRDEQEKRSMCDQLTKSVVSAMFSSSWRLDSLVEMPLKEVQLPAALFVRDPETKETKRYAGPMPGGAQEIPDITVLVRRPWPGAQIADLPPTTPSMEAISYVIRNHPQRGRFRPDRAIALGVERGRNWNELTNGRSVVNKDGMTITSDMVLEPGKQGGGVVIADLPTEDYVEAFVAREELKSKDVMDGVGAFFWLLGPGVSSNPTLRRFMDEMKHLKHIVSSKDHCPNRLALDSVASSTLRLRQIDPARYPTPIYDNDTVPQADPKTRGLTIDPLPAYATVAERGQVLQLEPTFELQEHHIVPVLDTKAVIEETSGEVLQLATAAQEAINEDRQELDLWANSIPNKDAEIIALGTGSALPSKYRNVSATLLRIPGQGSYLFDCGENTLGQLRRIYRPHELAEVLQDLKMIWISHLHADHHLGTVSVIKAWYEEVHKATPPLYPLSADDIAKIPALAFMNQNRLAVVSSDSMLHYLHEYSSVEDFGYSRIAPLSITPAQPNERKLSSMSWFPPPSPTGATLIPASLLNLRDVQAVAVQHCHGAKAVSVTFPTGFKVSYSGDCRPSKAFARIGKGSTVLIHEATFDDELRGDALAKKHSTTSEALGVGAAMGARATVLTHFSQRYQKIPVMEAMGEENGNGNGSDARAAIDELEDSDAPMDDADADAPIDDPTPPPSSLYKPTGQLGTATAPAAATAAAVVQIRGATARTMKVCVAFDYMRVRVGDIAQLEKFTPALIRLFESGEAVVRTIEQDFDGEGPRRSKEGQGKAKRGKGGA